MTSIIRTIILLVIMVSTGCAPKRFPVAIPRPVPDIPVHSGFLNAERAFENGLYTEALDRYNAFLLEAYDDYFVDHALYKVGKIYRLTGRNKEAVAVFARLTREFPRSALVSDAMLDILKIQFDAGELESVITNGLAFIGMPDPHQVTVSRQVPFLILIGDTYAALGAHLDAAISYFRAWNAASDPDKPIAWTNFKTTVEQLSADELQQLIAQVRDRQVMGLLLYRLGMAFIMDENYDDALDVLEVFVERFPEHTDYQDATHMIQSLTQRARFTPFTVGCVLPLSGAYAVFGQRALEGIELALSQSADQVADQAAKPDNGRSFDLLIKDSRSDPGATAEAIDQLDQQNVGAILGPMPASEAAAASAQAKGIPIIVFTQREEVPDIGPYVLRNFITPQMQVHSLVSFAVHELGVKRFAILYPDEYYGRRYLNLFWDQVLEFEGVVTGAQRYDPKGTDFAEPIKKMAGIFYDVPKDLALTAKPRINTSPLDLMADSRQSRRQAITDPLERISGIPLDREVIDTFGRRSPARDDQWHPVVDFDAVFIPDAPKKAGLIIPQLAYYDIRDVYLLGTNLWNSATLVKMAGEYMQDTLIADGFFADSQSAVVQNFVTAFQRIYDKPPGIIEAVAYDSAMMLFQTMRQTATDSRRELKAALLQIEPFNGVTGRTVFLPNGEAEKDLHMLQFDRGRFVQVERTADP